MALLTLVAVLLLTAAGMLHFYWAFGGTAGLDRAIPTLDGEPLFRPGRLLTLLVGVTLIGFGALACRLQFNDAEMPMTPFLGCCVSVIFLLRAVGEFKFVGFFKTVKRSGFAVFDTMFYAPLSLCLGLLFAVLSYLRM